MQSKLIRTNGIQLHYLEHEGNAPLIILMHGLTANAHAFDGLVAAGLSPDFQVISVDLRGRGLSDYPETGYGMKEHAADIIGLLDELNITKAIIGGHSFGALLTLYLAAHYPERIEKMILMDAAAKMHPNIREMLGPALGRLGQKFKSFEAYLEKVKQAPYITRWYEEMTSYYRADVKESADGTVTPRCRLDNMIEAVTSGSLGEPWEELIPKNVKPTILLNATGVYTMNAPLLPKELALETVAMMKNCIYSEIEGNHQTMLYGKGATEIVDSIRSFLN